MARTKPRPTGLAPMALGARLLLLMSVVSVVVGCASQRSGGVGGAGQASSSGTGSLPQIEVQRTGGFAGAQDTVTLDPHGTWNATNRAGTRTAGSLTPDQVSAIRTLADDPRLASEATQTRPPTRCRDAFNYHVTVGAERISYVDCPADPDQPSASIALVKAVLGYTILSPSRGGS